jgi:GT2 family glycosyltransferase
MKDLSQLSVLVTCFNKSAYIKQFLSNLSPVLALSAEVVIVDDCSTDGSDALLGSSLASLPNVLFLKNKENLGSAASRNRTLAAATRPYLLFWDIDDFLDVDILRKMLGEVLERDADLCRGYFSIQPSNQIDEEIVDPNSQECSISHFSHFIAKRMGYWRYIYRREFIQSNNFTFTPTFADLGGRRFILDDVFWMLQIASASGKIVFTRQRAPLYHYTAAKDTRSSWKSFQSQAKLFPLASFIFIKDISRYKLDIELAHILLYEKLQEHLRYLNIFQWLQVLPKTLQSLTIMRSRLPEQTFPLYSTLFRTGINSLKNFYVDLRSKISL